MKRSVIQKSTAALISAALIFTSGCSTSSSVQTTGLPQEAKQSLDTLVNENVYVTGYDFENYEYPAIIVDYAVVEKALSSKKLETRLQVQDGLDEIGKKVEGIGYNTIIFCSEVEGELKKIAMYEYGATFFNEGFIPFGLRARYDNLVVQNTQVDHSGYFPAIVGMIYNVGNTTYSSVYIEFNVLNEAGSIIGFANDSIGSLKSGDTWQFSCEVIQNASSFKISKVNYF